MRRSHWLLWVAMIVFSTSRVAAVELPFTGTLSFKPFAEGDLPAFVMEGAGVADAIFGPGQALVGFDVQPSVFSTQSQLVPVTDPLAFPIAGMIGTIANDAGAFAAGAGFGGTMPLQGTVKVCLFGTCSVAVANVTIPLSVVGHNATVDLSGGPIFLTVSGAPWTTRSVELPQPSGYPPFVIAGSRQTDQVNLVTPVFISTNIAAYHIVNSYARLVAHFEAPLGVDSCTNGLDDDGDGFADYPDDPGCDSAEDPSERTAGAPCDDGFDNDGDRRIDASDPGCEGPLDGSEQSAALVCDDGLDNDDDGVSDFPADTGCASPSDDSEKGARDCDDGLDDDGDGLVDYPADPGCSGASDRSERGLGHVCDDGLDNDEDGVADFPDDGGCASVDDPSERTALFVCDDGIDQDGDGRVDFPADPGCASSEDGSEHSPSLACDDGLDNDLDGLKDYPADPGRYAPGAQSEQYYTRICDNGLDDDGDGLIDSQQDPGCESPADPREAADYTDGGSHQIDGAHPAPDNGVYVGPAGDAPTFLWLGWGGLIADDLSVAGIASADVNGGAIGGDLIALDNATVAIRGGTIGGAIDARDVATVEIVGTGFDLPYGDVLATSGTINGFLRDGTTVSIPFTRALGATIRLVPEPGAALAALAAISTLAAVRKRRGVGA